MSESSQEIMKQKMMKEEGERIVAEGKTRGLYLRLLGAIAFQLHCPKYSFLTAKLGRMLSDIDVAAYGSDRPRIDTMMREFGYADQPMATAIFGARRMIWESRSTGLHVDLFFDKLEMNHDISFANRLQIEELTIPLADMILEKMQIVHMNEKDVIDTIILVREHAVGSAGPESIDVHHLARLLSNDWGFYYTVTTNLRKVQNQLTAYPELSEEDRTDVSTKIQNLYKTLEDEPKTLTWRLRAKVGTSRKWYRDVEDVNG